MKLIAKCAPAHSLLPLIDYNHDTVTRKGYKKSSNHRAKILEVKTRQRKASYRECHKIAMRIKDLPICNQLIKKALMSDLDVYNAKH